AERVGRALAPRQTGPEALRGTPPHARDEILNQPDEARLAFQVVNDRYGRQVVTIPTAVRDDSPIFARGDLRRAVGDANLHEFRSLSEAFDLVDQMPTKATAVVRMGMYGGVDTVVVLTKDSASGPVIQIRTAGAELRPIDRATDIARFDPIVPVTHVALFDENGVLIPPPAPSADGGGAPSPGPEKPSATPSRPATAPDPRITPPPASQQGGIRDPRIPAPPTTAQGQPEPSSRAPVQPQQVVWPEAPSEPADAAPRPETPAEPQQAPQPEPVKWPVAGQIRNAAERGPVRVGPLPAHEGDPEPRRHVESDLGGSVAGISDIGGQPGKRHPTNMDAFAIATVDVNGKPVTVAVVADGTSGSKESYRAARGAVDKARDRAVEALSRVQAGGEFVPSAIARESTAAAQQFVLDLAATDYAGYDNPPVTTIVLALIEEDRVTVDWVGDSRAYWIPLDGGPAKQLTRDDSNIPDLIDMFGWSEEEASRSA
ncbi:protein phosphatase 2C domain-containing protein, partial [Nocardia sp. NPDC019302]|uniref:PP2C family protein-serine/threonine phosphatase n=1 Tax=Nocardia sp. NPDC019302 TaxID=3154592 RepID=UPI0033D5B313